MYVSVINAKIAKLNKQKLELCSINSPLENNTYAYQTSLLLTYLQTRTLSRPSETADRNSS